ncbi:MAG: transcription antitermination factor NusB [Clostridia bacterium]|nr:MAG: transcription antitermination factor NusB [Clostridia bacterium]
MSRKSARARALQALFQVDMARADPEIAMAWILKEFPLAEVNDVAFARRMVRGTLQHQEEIDTLIRRHSGEWELERLGAVDRNIMRMALYELLFCPDIPPAVAIDQAVELAKIYAGGESGSFVNGVLDAVRRARDGEET